MLTLAPMTEIRIPLESGNIGGNKFRSETQHNYELVLNQITRMVDIIEKG